MQHNRTGLKLFSIKKAANPDHSIKDILIQTDSVSLSNTASKADCSDSVQMSRTEIICRSSGRAWQVTEERHTKQQRQNAALNTTIGTVGAKCHLNFQTLDLQWSCPNSKYVDNGPAKKTLFNAKAVPWWFFLKLASVLSVQKKDLQESLEVHKIIAESAKASINSSGLQWPPSEKVKLFLKCQS